MKRKKFERIFSFVCLAFTLGVVLALGLNGNQLEEMRSALSRLSLFWLGVCALCWCVYVLSNALCMYHFLKVQGSPVTLRQSLHAAMIGIYYCNITPGATGGQPMEMYALSRYGVSVGVSGSGMAVKFVVFQVMLLLTGAVLWIGHGPFVRTYAPGCGWFMMLGYAFNCVSISMVILMAVSRKAVRWVIERVIRIGTALKICKDPQQSRLKWENNCQSFLESVRLMIRRPRDMIVQCLIALMQLFSLMAVIMALYAALNLDGVRMDELLTMGVLLYIGASYTPLPGASGAQEGGFAVLFKGIFPGADGFIALLLWRFFTYYLSILAGALLTLWESVGTLKKQPVSKGEEAN